MSHTLFSLAWLTIAAQPDPGVAILAEEDVFSFTNPNNGSGPLWSYGCTQLARHGEQVFVSQQETSPSMPPLCNTRWRLLRRAAPGQWTLVAEAPDYRQRENCPVGLLPDSLLLYVNDADNPPGWYLQPCRPHLLRFRLADPAAAPLRLDPVFPDRPRTTEHSYRGFGVDRRRGEMVMVNMDGETYRQHWCLLSADGEALAGGSMEFPQRGCYPQVSLRNRRLDLMAISDIVEPVTAWREYKFEQTKQEWDYVFRILHYTWTPDAVRRPLCEPVEVANVEPTGGHIANHDLWLDPQGRAWLLYSEREVQSALLRDRFFPGKSVDDSLWLAIVEEGRVVDRRRLIAGSPERSVPWARFHEAADGRLFVFASVTGAQPRNVLLQVHPPVDPPAPLPVPLSAPFGRFCLASARAGNLPGDVLDVLGTADRPDLIRYAAIRLPAGR